MTDNVVILSATIGSGLLLLCATLFWMKKTETGFTDRQYREQVYSDLFYALTMVMIAGEREEKRKANLVLARTVHVVNLIAGPGVLHALHEILKLENIPDTTEMKRKQEHAALQNLVFAIRKETKRRFLAGNQKETESYFKFYMPIRSQEQEIDSL